MECISNRIWIPKIRSTKIMKENLCISFISFHSNRKKMPSLKSDYKFDDEYSSYLFLALPTLYNSTCLYAAYVAIFYFFSFYYSSSQCKNQIRSILIQQNQVICFNKFLFSLSSNYDLRLYHNCWIFFSFEKKLQWLRFVYFCFYFCTHTKNWTLF